MLRDHFVEKAGSEKGGDGLSAQERFEQRRARMHRLASWAELDRLGSCTCPACTAWRASLRPERQMPDAGTPQPTDGTPHGTDSASQVAGGNEPVG